jgi:mRNA-degrading endonuclease RelE of RelBE toxin-antitoxin system
MRMLDRLPEKVATAAIEFVYGPLAANPQRVGRELRLDLVGVWSARRGDYRVLYRIDDEKHRVDVVVIEHRRDVYRRRT